MLTLENFEKELPESIIKRGWQYFRSDAIVTLEEVDENQWEAEVAGSDDYLVKVEIGVNNKITGHFCDCPFEGDICKHLVAVFYALREKTKPGYTGQKKKATDKLVFEGLLKKVGLKEYQDFTRDYAATNKPFKSAFEIRFADKDERIDLDKKYTDLVKKLSRKYTESGYVSYRDSYGLYHELAQLLEKGYALVSKKDYRNAIALAKPVLKEIMNIIPKCDDSNGQIGGALADAVGLIGDIAISPDAAIELKDEIMQFLEKELLDELYFDYGDFGYDMVEIFRQLAVNMVKPTGFLQLMETQLSKARRPYDDYRRDFFSTQKIDFLRAIGRTDEAEKLTMQNLDIVAVRQGEVQKAISKKDFPSAKKLIRDGIQVARKQNHPGTVAAWEKELLKIADLEKDISLVRQYSKRFAFDRWFNAEYYSMWKKTYAASEWKAEIDKYIVDTTDEITAEYKRLNKGMNYSPNPALLRSLAPVLIEEKYWDRLFDLVSKAQGLATLLAYYKYLVKQYPTEILALFLSAFEHDAEKASNRNDYARLCSTIKKVMKDIPEGKDKIAALMQTWQQKYLRRPAMIDELNKIRW